MADDQGGDKGGPRLTIRLVGFQSGASQEELVAALGRLYRGKTPEEIRKALARVPFTLTRWATEEQARKIRRFLEAKGATVDITYQGVVRAPSPHPQAACEQSGLQASEDLGPIVAGSRPLTWAKDRRSRPRVHPGIPLEPMGIRDILGRSLNVLRENLSLFFLVLLVPNLVSFLLSKVLERAIGSAVGAGFSPGSVTAVVVVALAGIVVFLILFIWAEGALIYAVSEAHLGHQATVWGSYRAIYPRWGRFCPR